MPRRQFSGFSLGPVLIMLALVIIVVLWNHTQAPLGVDRTEGDFQVLGAVRLEENPGNDGDSFQGAITSAGHRPRQAQNARRG